MRMVRAHKSDICDAARLATHAVIERINDSMNSVQRSSSRQGACRFYRKDSLILFITALSFRGPVGF